jgi:hypothetical protein
MAANYVSSKYAGRGLMGFLSKLFSGKDKPKARVRICVECGMPIAEHKSWCSIYRTQQERDAARAEGPGQRAEERG